ncbi:hypothetical protein [Argonema antarcticum]|nr:hypothetical protein [Argonema antarcticum]
MQDLQVKAKASLVDLAYNGRHRDLRSRPLKQNQKCVCDRNLIP